MRMARLSHSFVLVRGLPDRFLLLFPPCSGRSGLALFAGSGLSGRPSFPFVLSLFFPLFFRLVRVTLGSKRSPAMACGFWLKADCGIDNIAKRFVDSHWCCKKTRRITSEISSSKDHLTIKLLGVVAERLVERSEIVAAHNGSHECADPRNG